MTSEAVEGRKTAKTRVVRMMRLKFGARNKQRLVLEVAKAEGCRPSPDSSACSTSTVQKRSFEDGRRVRAFNRPSLRRLHAWLDHRCARGDFWHREASLEAQVGRVGTKAVQQARATVSSSHKGVLSAVCCTLCPFVAPLRLHVHSLLSALLLTASSHHPAVHCSLSAFLCAQAMHRQ